MMNLNAAFDKETERWDRIGCTMKWAVEMGLDQIEVHSCAVYEDYISFKIPPTHQAFKHIRQQMGSGWILREVFLDVGGTKYIKYIRRGTNSLAPGARHLTVILDADLADGAICTRQQVSTKQIPVYKVVCREIGPAMTMTPIWPSTTT